MLPVANPNNHPLLKRLLETNNPTTVPPKRYVPTYTWLVPRGEAPLHYTNYAPIPTEALVPQLENHKHPNEDEGYVSQFDKKWAMEKKEKEAEVKIKFPPMSEMSQIEEEEEEKPKKKKKEYRTITFSNCLLEPITIRVKNE